MTADERKQLVVVKGHLTEAMNTVEALLASADSPPPTAPPSIPSVPSTPPVVTAPAPPSAGRGRKVGVCIGHSRANDNGASSVDGTAEWNFNAPIGAQVVRLLNEAGYEAKLFDNYAGADYGSAMSWIAAQLKTFGADIAFELHFNAANGQAQGYEYLHWHSSTGGKKLATAFHDVHKATHPGRTSRGVKALDSGSRGAQFLNKPHCPSVILEPFFGDNPSEWAIYKGLQQGLAAQYAAAVHKYFNG